MCFLKLLQLQHQLLPRHHHYWLPHHPHQLPCPPPSSATSPLPTITPTTSMTLKTTTTMTVGRDRERKLRVDNGAWDAEPLVCFFYYDGPLWVIFFLLQQCWRQPSPFEGVFFIIMTKRGPNNEVVWAPGNLFFFWIVLLLRILAPECPWKRPKRPKVIWAICTIFFFC